MTSQRLRQGPASFLSFLSLGLMMLAAWNTSEADEASDKASLLKGMILPEYDERGALLRPENFETRTFVGTSLGITYSTDPPAKGPGDFHNVYIQPEAFKYYVKYGEFPEKTLFVMTNSPASRKAGPDLINGRGHFAGKATGLEVSVKDSNRFDESWAYFLFKTAGPRRAAKALPTGTCYDCHAEHGADDNVFTQFYPVLEEARKKEKSK
ncbi:cytochrome P460 family protein [bacterium]|nr:cytochrome P460 family protein [bacterium]